MKQPTMHGVLILTLAAASLPALAQSYEVRMTCPAVLTLPLAGAGEPEVYLRDAETAWRPAEFTAREGRLTISLDPARFSRGHARLLINPPADMDIHDSAPPRLVHLEVDGERIAPEPQADLGAVSEAPRRLVFTVREEENTLDLASMVVTLNGDPVPARAWIREEGPRTALVRARIPEVHHGEHLLRYAVADTSPQRNTLRGRLGFTYQDLGNYVLAYHGTSLQASSHFGNYTSLDCLQDGNTRLPGDSLGNDVSWASAETETPHWVEVDFGRPHTIREVTIYWANYAHQFNSARFFEVQIPDGDDWKPVYQSPEEGEPESVYSRVEFEPVTVTRFRVWQPAGGGGSTRPNLMWLAEIQAR